VKPLGRIGAYGGRPQFETVQYGPLEGVLGQSAPGRCRAHAAMMGRMLIGEASLKNLSGP
jgi:hypothetical protein